MNRIDPIDRLTARVRMCGVVVLWIFLPTQSWALGIEQCISSDGHVYVIVSTSTASMGTQVTSVALTEGSVSACVQQAGPHTAIVSAFAGARGRPLANRMRTTVLSGFSTNVVSCEANFDPDAAGGKGALFLPSNAGRTVSADAASSSEDLIPVEEPDSLVPAAIDMPGRGRLKLRCGGDTMAFPLGGDPTRSSNLTFGEVANQGVTFDDTYGTRLGNSELPPAQTSPDGFLLRGNCTSPSTCQLVVFVGELGSDCRLSASASAAGFTVDGNLTTMAAEAAMHAGGARNCTSGD